MMRLALVVDDSMLIRHAVCRYFEDRGFAVESATNGLEALEMLRDLQPSIIVTDVQMPKMNGLQLIAALKSNPQTARIPIVVLATKMSTAENPGEIAADYIIFKDIDMESQLKLVLQTALPGDSSQR